MRMKYFDWLGIALAVPDDERTVVVTRHELFAIVEPANGAHGLGSSIEPHFSTFELDVPENDETTVVANEQLS